MIEGMIPLNNGHLWCFVGAEALSVRLSRVQNLNELRDDVRQNLAELQKEFLQRTKKELRIVHINSPEFNVSGLFLAEDNYVYVPRKTARLVWQSFFRERNAVHVLN